MRKRLLALAAALAFACLLAPSTALADEGGKAAVPVTIEIGRNGAPVDTSGDGWTYDGGELVLEAGYAFTFTGNAFGVSGENLIWNSGTIMDGEFVDKSGEHDGSAVHNEASGVIQGGTFTARVGNAGTIAGGTFGNDPNDPSGPYVSTSGGTIAGGTFDCLVMAIGSGAIEGGTFNGPVNVQGVDIAGGTFNGEVYNGSGNYPGGTIAGGMFNARVDNYGSIEDGEFNGYVYNGSSKGKAGTIAGGTFGDYVNNDRACTISGGVFNDGGNNNSVDSSGTITGGTFNINVNNDGTIEGAGTFDAGVQNQRRGIIMSGTFGGEISYNHNIVKGGTFNGALSNDGTIEGGTFEGEVANDGAIAGGAFADMVTSSGVIENGSFAHAIVNSGVIRNGSFRFALKNTEDGIVEGGTFEGSLGEIARAGSRGTNRIRNEGTIRGGVFIYRETGGDLANSGAIEGGAFAGTCPVTNFGLISNGTFGKLAAVANVGTIAGGTFNGALHNLAYYISDNIIEGGTFLGTVTNDGIVKNGVDAAGNPVIPRFSGPVANGADGSIEGGLFEKGIDDQGGTVVSCAYPLHASLTGLSMAEAEDAQLVAAYERGSAEANHYTLKADEGYGLPETIEVRCVSAVDGPELVAGADYSYDASTGAVAIEKNAVAGPLSLVANGIPAVAPPTPPEPAPPTPAPLPLPSPAPADTAASASPSNAAALAATGDDALPQIVLGALVLVGGVLLLSAAIRWKRSRL